jgi:hypothetical protein
MGRFAVLIVVLSGGSVAASDFDQVQAARFSKMAADCVHKEYPNKIANADEEGRRLVAPSR